MICQVCGQEMVRWQPPGYTHFLLACPVCGRKYDPILREVVEEGDRHRVKTASLKGGVA